MKPPLSGGARDFNGMDSSLAPTAPAHDRMVLDLSGNHEQQGAWETRRGFIPTGWEGLGAPVNAIACWENTLQWIGCLVSTGTAYYQGTYVPFPSGGYGTGGYGSQLYGSV